MTWPAQRQPEALVEHSPTGRQIEALPDSAAEESLDLSVVIPVLERPEPLDEIYHEYSPVLEEGGWSHEFIFVVAPWNKALSEPLAELVEAGRPIRVLQARRTLGEASMLKLAVSRCRGRLVMTLPAYHRVEAGSLGRLIEGVGATVDLTVARRWPRRDSWINRVQNSAFHFLIGKLARSPTRDTASGVRVMKRELLEELPLYGDFFRFVPILAAQEGYRVQEVECPQHAKDIATRLFSPATYFRRLVDLLGLFFLVRFAYKPLRFFGLIGSVLAIPGLLILATLFFQRIGGQAIADRPLLLLSVLLVTLGVQSIALGLVGEIIVHLHASNGRTYRLLDAHDDEERS